MGQKADNKRPKAIRGKRRGRKAGQSGLSRPKNSSKQRKNYRGKSVRSPLEEDGLIRTRYNPASSEDGEIKDQIVSLVSTHGPSFAEEVINNVRQSNEKRFWFYVFVDAMQCLGVFRVRKKENKYIEAEDWRNAVEWVLTNSNDVAGFQWVCNIFGFEPSAVLYRLQNKLCPKCDKRYLDQFDKCYR